ncbi:MAG TPA: PspC domain-containing protein [Caldithrix sp.]|nr:PspC domain-containing protein [Caldithrix sp.]
MKRLYRSLTDRKISGLCGGIGEVYNVDPNLLRLLVVLLLFVTGILPVLITYIIAWIIIPEGKPETPEPEVPKKTKKS